MWYFGHTSLSHATRLEGLLLLFYLSQRFWFSLFLFCYQWEVRVPLLQVPNPSIWVRTLREQKISLHVLVNVFFELLRKWRRIQCSARVLSDSTSTTSKPGSATMFSRCSISRCSWLHAMVTPSLSPLLRLIQGIWSSCSCTDAICLKCLFLKRFLRLY